MKQQKRIIIFAGTTEGRCLSERLSELEISHVVSVATEYGQQVMEESPYVKLCMGRMDTEEMVSFIQENEGGLVIDATHPYAVFVTENIKKACETAEVEYLRLLREMQDVNEAKVTVFDSPETCAKALENVEGNILLTTGSKDLGVYCQNEDVKQRLRVRVLPGSESIGLCEKQGLLGKQILAMQGPFSKEMNEAVLNEWKIGCMVTKQSGEHSGFVEKLQAAEALGIPVFVIGATKEEEGFRLDEIEEKLGFAGYHAKSLKHEIYLVGMGVGNPKMLTNYAEKTIKEADVILGARRLLEGICWEVETKPYYLAKDIIPYLRNYEKQCSSDSKKAKKIAILFSGDTGFFSGCKKLYQALQEEISTGNLHAQVEIIPGISSISYLSSKLGMSWEDAGIYSLHGREDKEQLLCQVISSVQTEEKTFVLTTGKQDVERLLNAFSDEQEVEIFAGYRLSYDNEQIFAIDQKKQEIEISEQLPEGLYTCLIYNRKFESTCLEKAKAVLENEGDIPRVMIAAGKSGSGKTLLTCGLLQYYKNRLAVGACKCGPDYIDPMFHRKVLGIDTENLDTYFTDEKTTRTLFDNYAKDYDLVLMEGVMGLYDGIGGVGPEGSAYHLAKVTNTPIILVVDAQGMGKSVIPMVQGYLAYDTEKLIQGVIFNRMSEPLYETLRPEMERELSVKLLGCVPKNSAFQLESRHLGLQLPEEVSELSERLQQVADTLAQQLDLEQLEEIAKLGDNVQTTDKGQIEISIDKQQETRNANCEKVSQQTPAKLTLAVAKDEAFCFYYRDNIKLLEQSGVKIQYFSPLHDKALPEGIHGILLGGGYPELYLSQLEANETMRQSICSAISQGMPSLAECGGFLYLHEELEDQDGQNFYMVGAVKGKASYQGKLVRFGYVELEHPMGVTIKGHEFHYYDSSNNGDAVVAKKPTGKRQWNCCHVGKNYWWGFPHLYYPSNEGFVTWFVEAMKEYKHAQKGD